jgi:2-dehydropantoate 2-reductase
MSKNIEHVYIFGLGAIGNKYASMLYDKNPDCVHVIVDEIRKERYEKEGFYVNDKRYDFNYVTEAPNHNKVDLIILGVKSLDLEQAIKSIKPFVQDGTLILSLLNGISTTEILNKSLPYNPAVYSIVYMDAVKNGNRINYGSRGKIVLGEVNNAVYTDRITKLCAFFDLMDINYEVPEDMLLGLWRKFLINVVGNQLTFIVDVGYEGLQDNPFILNLVQIIGEEVIKIANAKGIALQQSDIDNMTATMRKVNPKANTSMHQDRLQSRKSEVDIFAGEMIRLGKELNIETPYNNMLFNLIKAYEWERDERPS